jgi:hypothetical protein
MLGREQPVLRAREDSLRRSWNPQEFKYFLQHRVQVGEGEGVREMFRSEPIFTDPAS